jgi:hypothetical protein
MTHFLRRAIPVGAALLLAVISTTVAQDLVTGPPVDEWVTVTGMAAGEGLSARDEALSAALRKAVEQKCGAFINAQSQSENYKLVYDKIFASAIGFVREHKVLSTRASDGITYMQVRARVSTRKFQEDWATIAHTIERENNPRVLVAIAETTRWTSNGWDFHLDTEETGTVQSRVEDFLLSKGIVLVDRETAENVSKRDIMLASFRDDTKAIAAMGARFKADVVITGKATSKYGQALRVGEVEMHQYVAELNVRAIQTDSARLLASKNFRKADSTLQRGTGATKALASLADDSAPKLLAAIVEAWRKRAYVSRATQLNILKMDFATWKRFKQEVAEIRGVQAIRLREITEQVANVDVEYRYSNETLADHLTELEGVALEVQEISANRIKLLVVQRSAPTPPSSQPAGP